MATLTGRFADRFARGTVHLGRRCRCPGRGGSRTARPFPDAGAARADGSGNGRSIAAGPSRGHLPESVDDLYGQSTLGNSPSGCRPFIYIGPRSCIGICHWRRCATMAAGLYLRLAERFSWPELGFFEFFLSSTRSPLWAMAIGMLLIFVGEMPRIRAAGGHVGQNCGWYLRPRLYWADVHLRCADPTFLGRRRGRRVDRHGENRATLAHTPSAGFSDARKCRPQSAPERQRKGPLGHCSLP